MNRKKLERFLDEILNVSKFDDYSPNGLQVEGENDCARVLTGVTASQEFLNEAVRRGADTVIVHHGYFWKNEPPSLVGYRRQRLATVLRHNINLFAFHLPLDAHPVFGNNVQWGLEMGWRISGHFGRQNLGCWGELPEEGVLLSELSGHLEQVLERPPLVIGKDAKHIRRIAWCSGAAQDMIEEALHLGVDAYLSGEISERTTHVARENDLAYLACGHHATERFGPKALAAFLRQELGLDCEFVDMDNPA